MPDTAPQSWTLHDDRALPPGELRPVARQIYARTRTLPIVAMHGHVDAELMARDEPFGDPASLFVTPDHYLVRLLVSQASSVRGVPGVRSVADMGVPRIEDEGTRAERAPTPREIWRRFCTGWPLLRGTPTRYWLEHALVEVFGLTVRPSAESADALFDCLTERLAEPAFRPRALFERFGIEILSTTDSPSAALDQHAALRREGWGERVVPTFRPDALFRLDRPDWDALAKELGRTAGTEVVGYASYLEALRVRREAFVASGARASDHGATVPDTTPLAEADAARILDAALHGPVPAADADAFAAHMLWQTAAMACDDGLVMQLHAGVLRDHDRGIAREFGHDIGYDVPTRTDFVGGLRPMLEAFGHHPRFRVVAFTVDETTFSRELAPLAGVYPALRLGAPWWFLDSPDGMRRYREAVTETAGFYNTTGFVDDTRAFCSIPGRHDLARRVDAGYLARLVVEHRLDLDEAVETAVDLAYRLPRESYARPVTHPR